MRVAGIAGFVLFPALALSAGQSGDAARLKDGAGAWTSVRPDAKPSPKWQAERASAEKAVLALRQDSAANRNAKLQRFSTRLKGSSTTAEDAYRAAHYWFAFRDELSELSTVHLFSASCGATRGATDPEFMRMAYACLCISTHPRNWPGLGRRLMEIFPKDQLVKDAFAYDCMLATPSYEDAQLALTIVTAWPAQGVSERKVTRSKGYLYEKMYRVKKRKSDLNRALSCYREVLKTEPDAYGKEVMTERITNLEQRLKAGDFKEG